MDVEEIVQQTDKLRLIAYLEFVMNFNKTLYVQNFGIPNLNILLIAHFPKYDALISLQMSKCLFHLKF